MEEVLTQSLLPPPQAASLSLSLSTSTRPNKVLQNCQVSLLASLLEVGEKLKETREDEDYWWELRNVSVSLNLFS